jgi:WD40 repeat protein
MSNRFLRKGVLTVASIFMLVIAAHACSLPSSPITRGVKTVVPTATSGPITTDNVTFPQNATSTSAPSAPVILDPASAYAVANPMLAPAAQANAVSFGLVNDFVWLPDGSGIVLAAPGGVARQSLPSPEMRAQGVVPQASAILPADRPGLLTSARMTGEVAWASSEETIYVWNSSQDASGRIVAEGQSPVTGLALSPSGDKLAYSITSHILTVRDVANVQNSQSWNLPAWLTNLSYSPDGKRIGGVDLPNFMVYILDINSGKPVSQTLEWMESPSQALYGVYFSLDWEKVAWVAQAAVQVMDVADGKLGVLLSHEDFVSALAWAPDGRTLATASAATLDGKLMPVVIIWDAMTGVRLYLLPQEAVAQKLSFSPDGNGLAVLDSSGSLKVWDIPR